MHENRPPINPSRFGLASGLRSERFRADEIGLHPHTLLRARGRGELAFVQVGDRILYAEIHIAEWLARNERATESLSVPTTSENFQDVVELFEVLSK